MVRRNPSVLLMGIVLTLALGAAPIQAASTSQAVSKLIEVLHANGTIDDDAYEAIKVALAADAEQLSEQVEQAAVSASASAHEAKPEKKSGGGVKVRVDRGGLRVNSEDGAFAFRLGGRLQADSVWYDDNGIALGNGAEIRRMRLEWRGTLWEDWRFYSSVEFAGNIGLRGATITYTGFDPLEIEAGFMKEPFSLDQLGSSNYTRFMERASVANALSPPRNIGVAVSSSGDHWTAKLGAFWNGDNDGDPEDTGFAVTGRGVWRPIYGEGRLLHLGAAASMRTGGEINTFRARARPESHVTDTRLVDTMTLADVHDTVLSGLELAAAWGPWSFQGEYIGAYLMRDGMSNPYFNGWYAQTSVLLTGESRPYVTSRAVFGNVKPRRNFSLGEGGPGAWELAARFSNLDLNDAGVVGGEQDLITLGLNWYPNPNLRFMFNWVHVLDVDRPGNAFDGKNPNSFGLRGQVAF